MPEFDFAIVGTNLLSGLLAGVLARDHGKKVVRIGRARSAQRLPRHVDLALPLATRPESWRMLSRARAETGVLLGSLGITESIGAADTEILADLPLTAEALDHLAHMAAGYGHQVGRVEGGWAFRRVAMLDSERIEHRLPDWLRAAGAASLEAGTEEAALTVLADDEAIFEAIAEGDRPSSLISQAMASSLVVSRPLQMPIRRFADRGVTLVSRPGNTVLGIVSGEADVDARLASTLPGPFPMKRLATTRYRRLVSADGAPIVGKLGKQFVIAGLDGVAPFFAPAIARFLAGTSESDEKRWFAAHAPGKDRAPIADFVPASSGTAA